MVAEGITKTQSAFHDLRKEFNAQLSLTMIHHDEDHNLIWTESSESIPLYREDIPAIVNNIFYEFGQVLHNEQLYSALHISNAKFLGIPSDVMNIERS